MTTLLDFFDLSKYAEGSTLHDIIVKEFGDDAGIASHNTRIALGEYEDEYQAGKHCDDLSYDLALLASRLLKKVDLIRLLKKQGKKAKRPLGLGDKLKLIAFYTVFSGRVKRIAKMSPGPETYRQCRILANDLHEAVAGLDFDIINDLRTL